MIDIAAHRAKFEERCLVTGLTKLAEPIDTEEFVCCATEIRESDDLDNWLFESMMKPLMQAIIEREKGEFYRLDVTQEKNIVIFMSSRGDNTVASAWPDTFKWKSGRYDLT